MGRHRTRVTETVQGPPGSRAVLVAGAQSLLEATASRMRDEVQGLDGDLLDEKLLLLQQLDHLDAALLLLGRLIPVGSEADTKLLLPDDLCEACRHLNMAIHTMLALAPKFREATSHRLMRQLGSSFSLRFDCCSGRRPAVELSPEKRKSRMRVQLDKLEKQHENCLLDLLLTFEYLATAEVLPPPDTPARCAEGARYVLGGQAKLHQSHAMLCQLLVEEDDLLLPILEWQLGAAGLDFAVARAVLDRLPRASSRRKRNKIESHPAPLTTVGVRCESKATFLPSPPPEDTSVRLADSSQRRLPAQAAPHLPQSPTAAAMPGKTQDCCRGCVTQEARPSVHSPDDDCQRSRIQPNGPYVFHSTPPNVRNSGSLPDLGALGPCDPCSAGTPVKYRSNLAGKRCCCGAADCPSRRDGRFSPLDPELGDYASWASMVGSDYRLR